VWALHDRRAAAFVILSVLTVAVAACGGGSSGGGGTKPPTPPQGASESQQIGAGGGMLSVNYGIYTATVTVPAGALPATTTVTLELYGTGHGPVEPVAKRRSTLALGAGATELAELQLNTDGEALVLPVHLSLIGVATPASGTDIRLAGYGSTAGFSDVDTVTLTGNTASEDGSNLYPDASSGANALYAFYEISSTNVLPPSTPVVTISGTNPAPAGATTQYTASETNGNGFPFLTTAFTYSIDNSQLGSMSSSGQLSAGALDATGNVTAVDQTAARGNPRGSLAIAVGSARPGNTGDAFTFTGTITSSDQIFINPPLPTMAPQVVNGTVTLNTTGGTASPSGGSTVNVASTSTEVDKYTLETVTTTTNTTTAYGLASGLTTVSVLSTDATDSNNAEYINTYGSGNGLLDVLPETAGAFGPNNAALTYQENDPANYSLTRTTNGDGSYTENDTDAFGDVETMNGNADFSGTYDATQYNGFSWAFTAPSGSPATITLTSTNNNQSPAVVRHYTFLSWIPTSLTHPSVETDTDAGVVSYPGSCAVPAKYGTSGNKIVQSITRADTALGNLETETITTYVNQLYGPVCLVMTDNVQTYYDYTLQEGPYSIWVNYASPAESTLASETLTLSSATTSAGTLGMKRQTASAARTSYLPLAFARSRFERTVREHLQKRRLLATRKSASGVHAK
jgi:hypothetical protein